MFGKQLSIYIKVRGSLQLLMFERRARVERRECTLQQYNIECLKVLIFTVDITLLLRLVNSCYTAP